MKSAVIYARFSCSAQNEQSIEGQLRVCKEYAKKNDITIVKEYIDRAKSGTTDARPSFQQMIKDCNSKQWNYVLVYKLDRFSRDKYDSAIYKRTLKQNGIKVISATESIPDSPEAIIFESVLEGFAQYYSAELAQKVKRGMKECYIKGQYTGGSALPYGYIVKNKRVYIDEAEASIVKEIFNKYLNKNTAKDIQNDLTLRGIRNKKGKPFTTHAIYDMLKYKCYTGVVTHDGIDYDNIYPRIISDEVWEKVNAIHQRHIINPKKEKNNKDYILTYKLRCGYCNELFTGSSGTSKTGNTHRYYVCNGKTYKKNCKNGMRFKKEELEQIILNTTCSLFSSKNDLNYIAKRIVDLHNKSLSNNTVLKSLEAKKSEAESACANLTKAIEAGIFNKYTQSRYEELTQIINDLDSHIYEEKQKIHSSIKIEDIKAFLTSLSFDDIKNNVFAQKELVNTFIKEIIAYKDKIVIKYNIDKQTNKIISRNTECVDNMQAAEYSSNNCLKNFNNSSCVSSFGSPKGDFNSLFFIDYFLQTVFSNITIAIQSNINKP